MPRIYGFRVYGRVGSRGAGVLERIEEDERAKEAEGARATALIRAIEDAQTRSAGPAAAASSSGAAMAVAASSSSAVAESSTAAGDAHKAVKRASRPGDGANCAAAGPHHRTGTSIAGTSALGPELAPAPGIPVSESVPEARPGQGNSSQPPQAATAAGQGEQGSAGAADQPVLLQGAAAEGVQDWSRAAKKLKPAE